MKKIIYHLRRQPEEVRRQVLYIVMLVFIIILIFLWAMSLSKSFSNPDNNTNIKRDLEPFSKLKDDMANTYNQSAGN